MNELNKIKDKYFYSQNGDGFGFGIGYGFGFAFGFGDGFGLGFGFGYDIDFKESGLCKIGCKTLPIKTWLGPVGKELAEIHNVSRDYIEFIKVLLESRINNL